MSKLNLASRPHLNNRPVVRVAIALWIAAVLSCSASFFLYWKYFTFQGENAETLRETEAEIEHELGALEGLLGRLDGEDLESQERENEALNQRIAQRVFSWSALFDRVAEVLPSSVSLDRIAPRVTFLKTALGDDPRTHSGSTIVDLSISGTARNDDALLLLIDRLFNHPSFARPNLSSETRRKDRELNFSMTVTFLPEATGELAGDPPTTVAGSAQVSVNSEKADESNGSDGSDGSEESGLLEPLSEEEG